MILSRSVRRPHFAAPSANDQMIASYGDRADARNNPPARERETNEGDSAMIIFLSPMRRPLSAIPSRLESRTEHHHRHLEASRGARENGVMAALHTDYKMARLEQE